MKNIFLALIILCLSAPAFAAEKESTFDRVTRTQTIRCGYADWSPFLVKDPNTGKISGLFYDVMEQLGKRLNIKIDWTEEVGYGAIIEGLRAGRYDMICTALAQNSTRVKAVDFSMPLFFMPFYVISRKDDTRFDKTYDILNDPKYKLAVLDGELSSVMAAQFFPKATQDALSQTADLSLMLKEVETKKADVGFLEPVTFMDYEAKNPGLLKIVDKSRPLNMFAVSFLLPINDTPFKRMIDVTLNELVNDGTLTPLIKKYEKYPGTMLLPTPPYQMPK